MRVRGCHNPPMRFFNTAGPVRSEDHYATPPVERGDVSEPLGPVTPAARKAVWERARGQPWLVNALRAGAL